ncbi:MAG: hypothetical protein ACLVJH_16455 [Faecalibacterium prausnitzii]
MHMDAKRLGLSLIGGGALRHRVPGDRRRGADACAPPCRSWRCW